MVNLSANLPSKAFENLLSCLDEEYENYSLCADALGSMKGVSQLARALKKTEKKIKENEEIELKITKEFESGLPKLNSHVLVNIWSAFETCFNEYCVLSIVSNPSLAANESMKKIRIPTAYLYQSDPTATASAVLEEVMRSTGASMKGGLGRFTCVLEHLEAVPLSN